MPLLPKFHENPKRTSVKMTTAMDSSLEGKSKSNPLPLTCEALGDRAHKLPPHSHHHDAIPCAAPSD